MIPYCSQPGPKALLGLSAAVVTSTAGCQLAGRPPGDSHRVLERPVSLSSGPTIWMSCDLQSSWEWFGAVSRESLRTLEKWTRQPQPSSRSFLSALASLMVWS